MPGRNDPCSCGSGRKFKHCCGRDASDATPNAGADAAIGRTELKRAETLERQGRIDDAIAAYRWAAAFPDAAGPANSRLGHLLLVRGRAREAAEALHAAVRADPARRLDLVRALLTEQRDGEAEVAARGVVADEPGNADAQWLLGRILSESGRFEEAKAALTAAVAADPRRGAAFYDLVRCFTLTEADRPLVGRMLAAQRKVVETDGRIRLQLALGKAMDDLGDPRAAMAHFTAAGRLKSSVGRFDAAGVAARADRLIARFTPAFLARHAPNGDPSPRPLFVTGMPRSGTTLVEQVLSSHREVAGAGELPFWPAAAEAFARLDDDAQVTRFQREVAGACLANLETLAPGAARVADKTPLNILWAGVIHLVFPNAVIVHCRRDPLDTCVSILSTYFSPRPDFPGEPADLVGYYRGYERLAAHWRALVPADRFVEIDYATLVTEPEPTIRALLQACGLAWDDACLRPELNDRIVRTPSKWQARQAIGGGSVGRGRRYGPWLGPLAELIATA
jgi:tetratricopeptide (TPR) repeat protein